jgi:hypothetical protein
METSMKTRPAKATLAGRLQNSAIRFSILAMSFWVASPCPAAAVAFPGVASGGIIGGSELIIAAPAPGFAAFSSLSCSFKSVICWLFSRP